MKLFLDSLLDIFYDISFTQDKITLTSKITEISNSFWSSEENTKEFNNFNAQNNLRLRYVEFNVVNQDINFQEVIY